MTPGDDREREAPQDAAAGDGDAPRDDAPRADGSPADEAPTLTLQDALKLAGFVGTGGQAKRIVQAGEVLVNGAVETRRKRRLRPGDEITVGDETFVLELEDDEAERP